MTHFVAKFKIFFGKEDKTPDPVYTFFFESSSRHKKRVYSNALKKAQLEQEKVLETAKEKARV